MHSTLYSPPELFSSGVFMFTSTIIQGTLAITICGTALLAVFFYTNCCRSTLRNLMLAHLLGILLWAYGILIILRTENIIAAKLSFAAALVLATAKYYFVYLFPENKIRLNAMTLIPIPLSLAALYLCFSDTALFSSITSIKGSYIVSDNGPYRWFYASVIALLLIVPICNLVYKRIWGTYPVCIKKQITYLLLGLSLFFALGITTNSVLPAMFHIYIFNGLGPSFSLILAGFILYTVSRYNFLDISLLIQRSLIYLILFSGITSAYVLIITILGVSLQHNTETQAVLSAYATALIGIITVPRIDRYLKRKTDPIFFKGGYQYERVLYELSDLFNKSLSVKQIVSETVFTLTKTLRAEAITITLSGEIHTQPRAFTTLIFPVKSYPLLSDTKRIGTLWIGHKRSGDDYTAKDIQLIETIARQLAVALQRAQLYQEVKMYSQDLEKKVQERTQELECSYKNQQILMQNISHGLQTPLTILRGELEILRKHTIESRRLRSIEHSVTDISNFIYDLLKLAQMESATDILQTEVCNLSILIEEIITYTSLPASDQGISLTSQIEPEVYTVCNPKKIEETVITLLNNAMKYLGKNEPRKVDVRMYTARSTVVIEIIDSGIGIAEEHLEQVFKRFYRIKDKRALHISGSGLGLSLAKAIVEKHGGSISIRSNIGIGSTFSISLPLRTK